MTSVSKRTHRRFVLGSQGLWPARRHTGLAGTRNALRLVEPVQIDPLNVIARSHDLVLHSRVTGYRPEYLDRLLYKEREFFDYGGLVRIMPMADLPYVRARMRQVPESNRWRSYAHESVLSEVRVRLREQGPMSAREFPGAQTKRGFRSSKQTSVALYYLWLTGEVMTFERRNFERVYALRADVAPPECDYTASDAEADAFFARKACRWIALFDARTWAIAFWRRTERAERAALLRELVESGYLNEVDVEGSRQTHYVRSDQVEALEQIEADGIPTQWRSTSADTTQEAVLVSPFDTVTRGPRTLFAFEFLFEAYKPAARRRWGYYAMPILYGDEFVARLDPAFDRRHHVLEVKGLWLEDERTATDEAFVDALAAGLVRMARFVGAGRVDVDPVGPQKLRARLRAGTAAL